MSQVVRHAAKMLTRSGLVEAYTFSFDLKQYLCSVLIEKQYFFPENNQDLVGSSPIVNTIS